MLYKMNITKGHIYIIFCNVNPKIYYVGSTFNELKQRWINHKNHYKEKQLISIYKYFDEYGIENFTLKLIKSYDVYREHNKDRKHLEAYELLWINKLKGCCNQILPFNPLPKLSKQLYYEKNKEQSLRVNKKWRDNNKETKKQIDKNYYKKNKEHLLEVAKKYKINNKEQIAEKRKEKITCECGSIFGIWKRNRHIKSNKHQDYIKNNIIDI